MKKFLFLLAVLLFSKLSYGEAKLVADFDADDLGKNTIFITRDEKDKMVLEAFDLDADKAYDIVEDTTIAAVKFKKKNGFENLLVQASSGILKINLKDKKMEVLPTDELFGSNSYERPKFLVDAEDKLTLVKLVMLDKISELNLAKEQVEGSGNALCRVYKYDSENKKWANSKNVYTETGLDESAGCELDWNESQDYMKPREEIGFQSSAKIFAGDYKNELFVEGAENPRKKIIDNAEINYDDLDDYLYFNNDKYGVLAKLSDFGMISFDNLFYGVNLENNKVKKITLLNGDSGNLVYITFLNNFFIISQNKGISIYNLETLESVKDFKDAHFFGVAYQE